jgi:hypothetical protein
VFSLRLRKLGSGRSVCWKAGIPPWLLFPLPFTLTFCCASFLVGLIPAGSLSGMGSGTIAKIHTKMHLFAPLHRTFGPGLVHIFPLPCPEALRSVIPRSKKIVFLKGSGGAHCLPLCPECHPAACVPTVVPEDGPMALCDLPSRKYLIQINEGQNYMFCQFHTCKGLRFRVFCPPNFATGTFYELLLETTSNFSAVRLPSFSLTCAWGLRVRNSGG